MTHQLFIAEGIKVVEELLNSSLILSKLYCTESYSNPLGIKNLQIITEKELGQISEFSNPNQVLGIFEIPQEKVSSEKGLTVALDEINDPGNLGTIIRLCDWFGVQKIVCSENTVDCFNPKVVQASMGSLSRVIVHYTDLKKYLTADDRTVYGTFINGANLYKKDLGKEAIIVLGNEANGISKDIEALVDEKLSIPQFGSQRETESLNVATATAIFLSEFKRAD